MNTQRIIVLGFALVAAGGAAFLVRGMLGGGAPAAAAKPAPQIAMSEVLVANVNLTPGQALNAEQIRWEKWPTATVDPSFITHEAAGKEEDLVKGAVVRAMILPGQPITKTALVHGDATGFMAATLSEGMRAISIAINTDSGAGGFILPNDKVDVILTRKLNGGNRSVARTILTNLRVLAVDQTFKQEKDTRTVIGRTATIEVSPEQAETIAAAAQSGQLSLALRALTDGAATSLNNPDKSDNSASKKRTAAAAYDGPVSVIRYGITGTANRQEPE